MPKKTMRRKAAVSEAGIRNFAVNTNPKEARMKLVYFNDFRLGVLRGDQVVDVTPAVQKIPHTGPGDLMNGLIARWG